MSAAGDDAEVKDSASRASSSSGLSEQAIAMLLTNDEDADEEDVQDAMNAVRPLIRSKKVKEATKIMQLLLYVRDVTIILRSTESMDHEFTTNADHSWDPVYFLQFNNEYNDILHDEENLHIEEEYFVNVYQCPDHIPDLTNMHGKFARDHNKKDQRKETCISIATVYLAEIIAEGGLTLDGEEVRTIEEVEERTTKKKKVASCKQRVEDLFALLRTVVPKKKRAAGTELTTEKTKKQKKKATKKRKANATSKSKKAKKTKKSK